MPGIATNYSVIMSMGCCSSKKHGKAMKSTESVKGVSGKSKKTMKGKYAGKKSLRGVSNNSKKALRGKDDVMKGKVLASRVKKDDSKVEDKHVVPRKLVSELICKLFFICGWGGGGGGGGWRMESENGHCYTIVEVF